MINVPSERSLCTQLEEYLVSNGFQTFREVPLLSRRIDLLGVNDSEIVAVELKVRDWRRALQQALSNRLCADRVYIALLNKYVHRVDVMWFRRFGVGVFAVDRDVHLILEAPYSKVIHPSLRRRVLSYVYNESELSRL